MSSVVTLPRLHYTGKIESDACAVYLLVADQGDGVSVVKIGSSTSVYQRYSGLLTGVPFPSRLEWFWAGNVRTARRMERRLHVLFAEQRTTREWFRFAAGFDFVRGAELEYIGLMGKPPAWKSISEGEAAAWLTQTRPKKPYSPMRGKKVARKPDFL